MTSPDPRWDVFARAEHVLLLLAYTTSATVFAIALWFAVSWLVDVGQRIAAVALVGVYSVITLPILVAQLGVVVDLLFVFVNGTAVAVPAFRAMVDTVTIGWRLRVTAYVLSAVCPFSSLSTWVWSIALRPSSAGEIARVKHRTEAAITAAAWRRLKKLA